jgi:hypothetical protein
MSISSSRQLTSNDTKDTMAFWHDGNREKDKTACSRRASVLQDTWTSRFAEAGPGLAAAGPHPALTRMAIFMENADSSDLDVDS